jgi:hypothetical protein
MAFTDPSSAFRSALNGIREQQGRLAEQNDILSAEIDDLESEVDRYVLHRHFWISYYLAHTKTTFQLKNERYRNGIKGIIRSAGNTDQ